MSTGNIAEFLAAEGFSEQMKGYGATMAAYQRHALATVREQLGLKPLSGRSTQEVATQLNLDRRAFGRFAYACEAVGLAMITSTDQSIRWDCDLNGITQPVDFSRVEKLQKELVARSSPQAWIMARSYEFFLRISRYTLAPDNIIDCLHHGRTRWEITRGHTMANVFDLYETEQRWLEIFQCAMFSSSLADNLQIAQSLNLDGKDLLDVGGASATLALSAREVAPSLRRFDVYDRSGSQYICKRLAASVVGNADDAPIDAYFAGDFFAEGTSLQGIPEGAPTYDIIFLARILHDWERDEDVRLILSRCRSHLKANGSVCILERVLPADCRGPTALYDFTMLVTANGVERTKAEYDHLLEAAGFSKSRMIPSTSLKNILLAQKK